MPGSTRGVDPDRPGYGALVTTDRLHLVRIHLDDHRAGAAGGAALARRMVDEWTDDVPTHERLRRLADAIDEDVEALDRIRDAVGASGGTAKRALALAGERLGRLKPNGRLRERSPLSLVQELEQLGAGIDAKRRLWASLQPAVCTGVVVGVDLHDLRERAEGQLATVTDLHSSASAAAFGSP